MLIRAQYIIQIKRLAKKRDIPIAGFFTVSAIAELMFHADAPLYTQTNTFDLAKTS